MTAPADKKLLDLKYSELFEGSSIEEPESHTPSASRPFNIAVGAPVRPNMPSSNQRGQDQSSPVQPPSPDLSLNPAYGSGEQARASRLWLHTVMRERQHVKNDVPDEPDQANFQEEEKQRKSKRKQAFTKIDWRRPIIPDALAISAASQGPVRNPVQAAPVAGTTQFMNSSQSQRPMTAAKRRNTTQVMNPSASQSVVTAVSGASRTKRMHSTSKKMRWEVPETIHEERLSNER